MTIHGLTVCVNYADLLAQGLDRWLAGLASLTVVTDLDDEDTANLIGSRCRLHKTDVFYASRATFNKGAAMEQARRLMPWGDWILFFDSDIVPPTDWIEQARNARLTAGVLYGAKRWQAGSIDDDGSPAIPGDGIGVGFFQLFHSGDPRASAPLETCWPHAGNYDNEFMHRWPEYRRWLMPFRVAHVGERENWWGRGNRTAMDAMRAERHARGGYQHERMAT